MKKKMKKRLAFLLTAVLLAGTLPLSDLSPVQAATSITLKNPVKDEKDITTWDCVWFGNYWQEDTNKDGKADKDDEQTPIKWRVLSVKGDDAFLMADKNLESKPYHEEKGPDVTWKTCTIRSYLNGYWGKENAAGKDYRGEGFIDYAFTDAENQAIKTATVKTGEDSVTGIDGGIDTSDKIYFLSAEEATDPAYGFVTSKTDSAKSRRALNTAFNIDQGAYTSKDEELKGNGFWWLRSQSENQQCADYVGSLGWINKIQVYNTETVVRPVLHLDLSSTVWSYAGTVTSEGTAEEKTPPLPEPQPEEPGLKNPVKSKKGITTWDCVWFGDYWQEDTNGDGKADKDDEQTPIKWRILSVKDGDAFLMADKNLDCVQYNDQRVDVTWETCAIRSYLNGYEGKENAAGKDYRGEGFIDYAFTDAENQAIKTVTVKNGEDSVTGIDGGNDTSDKIYFLSTEEAMNRYYGFAPSDTAYAKNRRALNTAFTSARGAFTSKNEEDGLVGNGLWWLRSPGKANTAAAYTGSYGDISTVEVFNTETGVRPVLHLDLSSEVWSYAGTVTSEGEVNELEPLPNESTEEKPEPDKSGLENPVKSKKGITTWDCVWFGDYWQEDTNGDGKANTDDKKTPIKWRVLSVKDGDAFLMADKNLESKRYHEEKGADVTWENCTIRSWLNGYAAKENAAGNNYSGKGFIDYAFTDAENQAIKTATVKNGEDSVTGVDGGNDTSDKIYFLSAEEAMNRYYGFAPSDKAYAKNRRALNTAFNIDQGAYTSHGEETEGNGFWWLRSKSANQCAAYVGSLGWLDRIEVFNVETVVRPVLHLDLSSKGWSYAGTVTSEGEVFELELNRKYLDLDVGEKEQLSVKTSATEAPQLQWMSTDEKVASVDAEGRVTAVSAGTADIKAIVTYNNRDYSLRISVTVKETLPPAHTHKYGNNWKSDSKKHWHVCACGAKSAIAAHKKDKGRVTKAPTTTKTGIRTYKCSVCGYVMQTETISKLPPTQAEIRKNSEKLNSGASIGWNGNNLALSWGKADGAEGYDIFAVPCGKMNLDAKSALSKTMKGQKTSTSLTKVAGKKISGKEVYKTRVKSWRYVKGKKAYNGSSRIYYAAGKTHPKYTNAKQLKAAKKTYALKKGRSVRIKVTIVRQSTKKKLLPKSYGAALQYTSGNKTIATVTQNGTVKAKAKGSCYITATALNGVKTKIKITVK